MQTTVRYSSIICSKCLVSKLKQRLWENKFKKNLQTNFKTQRATFSIS